jgi:hypothetical protein
MSTTFKKGWYQGKPLRELQPNTKYFKYWYLGKPFRLFDKPAIASTSFTVQLSECLHLTFTKNVPSIAVVVSRLVSISTTLHLTFALDTPSLRAGVIDSANLLGTGVEILYDLAPVVNAYGTGAEVVFAPFDISYVSQVVVQVEYLEIGVEVDQVGIVVVSENVPIVQVNQAGVAVVFSTDGIFLVNAQHLTLTLHAPTVLIIVLEVSGLNLTLTLHAPYVSISYHVIALPVTKHLTFSQKSPTFRLGSCLTVGPLSLHLNVYSPLIIIGAILHEVLDAILAIHSPVVCYGTGPIPIKLSLVFSIKSVTIYTTTNISVVVPAPDGIKSFELYSGGLNYHVGDILVPIQTGGYGASFRVLSVSTGGVVTELAFINHGSRYSIATQVSMNVIPSGGTQCKINILSLDLYPYLAITSVDASIFTGAKIGETLYLTLSLIAPIIHTSSINIISTIGHLVFQKRLPAIHVSTRIAADLQSLLLHSYDVIPIIGCIIKTVAVLTLHLYDVTVCYGSVLIVDTLSLVFTIPHPIIIGEPFDEQYDIDPLHKEREWGSSLELSATSYLSRSGNALSNNFPLKSNDTDKRITVCCWLRLKDSLPVRQTVFAKLLTNVSYSISLGLCLLQGQPYLIWPPAQNPSLTFESINLVTNRWYHIGLVVDGLNRTVYFQVWDDKAKTTTCVSWTPTSNPGPQHEMSVGNGDFQIGYYDDQFSHAMPFNGYIDEFVVFNDLKSAYEIDEIRKGTFNGPGQGQTVVDFGLMTFSDPLGHITIFDHSFSIGYDPALRISVLDYGLTIGYREPVIPPVPRFPVISGFPSPGSGAASYVFCNLAYKFKSDISFFEYRTDLETRVSQYSLPIRELETMIGIADESAYLRIQETLESGAMIYSVPIWAFRTVLDSNAHAGDLEFVANDVLNLYAGEKALLVRANDASIYDLCDITGIVGHTVTVATALTLHHHKFQMPTTEVRYDERSCYVVPCITGFVDAQDVELKGNKSTFWLKAKVNGSAWTNAGSPSITDFIVAPAEAGFITPKVERTLVGTENGLIEMMPHMYSGRLSFQIEWYFKDTSWRDFRDLFIAAKGRAGTIAMPTWCFELRVMANENVGSTLIYLTPGFSFLWERFPRLLAYPLNGDDPFPIQLTALHETGNVFLEDWTPFMISISWSDGKVGVTGFCYNRVIPRSLVFTVTLVGHGVHSVSDSAGHIGDEDPNEGLLEGEDVEYGFIFYASGTFFFQINNVPIEPSSMTCTATYDYAPYSGVHPEFFSCEPLTRSLQAGDKVSLYPDVRFMEDELVFEFIYYNECKVKTSFIEVIE